MNIITPLPNECYLACSGGIDSMFALHFLRQSKRNIIPLFFNHGTETSNKAEQFLKENDIPVVVGRITKGKEKKESPEEYFRRQRYTFFSAFTQFPIVTCHHLDDQIETAVMGFLQNKTFRIPYKRGNFIRPFLNVTKDEIKSYAKRHKLKWIEDESNKDILIPRNRIRHLIIPQMKFLNPGIYKKYLTHI